MDTLDITETELLRAIEEMTSAPPDEKPGWRSTEEWQEFWGCSQNRADKVLKRAHGAGMLECSRRQSENRIGAVMWVPVYRIKVKE